MTDTHRKMLTELMADDSDVMTVYEAGIIEGLNIWPGDLRPGQIHILEQIYVKVFG